MLIHDVVRIGEVNQMSIDIKMIISETIRLTVDSISMYKVSQSSSWSNVNLKSIWLTRQALKPYTLQ